MIIKIIGSGLRSFRIKIPNIYPMISTVADTRMYKFRSGNYFNLFSLMVLSIFLRFRGAGTEVEAIAAIQIINSEYLNNNNIVIHNTNIELKIIISSSSLSSFSSSA